MREARRRPAGSGRLLRWLPVIAWMLVIFAFSSIPNLDPDGGGRLNFGISKLGHVAVFSVLGLLVGSQLALRRVPRWLWWTFVFCSLYAITDEIHQWFVPGRDPSVRDVGIDAISAVLGGAAWPLVARRWIAWRRRRRARIRRAALNRGGQQAVMRPSESRIDDPRNAP
jgi:VanZ family protein